MKQSFHFSSSRNLTLVLVLTAASLSLAAAPTRVGGYRPGSVVQPGPETQDNLPLEQARQITTFSLLPSGLIGITAAVGDVKSSPRAYSSAFDLSAIEASPGYFSVPLTDNQVTVDMTTAGRDVALYRFIFPESEKSSFVLDFSHPLDQFRGGNVWERDRLTVEAFGTYQTEPGKEQILYFSFQFSKAYRDRGVWIGDDTKNTFKASVKDGSTLGFYGSFWSTHEGESVLMKVGVSTVSVDDARAKLAEQCPGWDFKQIRGESEAAWK